MGLPRVGNRPQIPGRGETRRDCRWRRGATPGGAPRAGPVMSRGPAAPRWTSRSRRGAAAPRWRTDGARPGDEGESDTPDARDANERWWAVRKGPHPAAIRVSHRGSGASAFAMPVGVIGPGGRDETKLDPNQDCKTLSGCVLPG
ncbi:hypothetical protein NDU88_007925 [Pleurodeles waltl]|uniref:Uncharacterized protein n=1 Tax=Pleurodeles waltl TaxID=8319 RepID=A0AAV7QM17_PLEWA|nr:hypothetical protein NDU88_007925 [Pleurodeles waltl]